MDPIILGKNVFKEELLLGSTQFFITCYFVKFFYTSLSNFSNMLFQVFSVDRLGEPSFKLSLLKVHKREEALSEFI